MEGIIVEGWDIKMVEVGESKTKKDNLRGCPRFKYNGNPRANQANSIPHIRGRRLLGNMNIFRFINSPGQEHDTKDDHQ